MVSNRTWRLERSESLVAFFVGINQQIHFIELGKKNCSAMGCGHEAAKPERAPRAIDTLRPLPVAVVVSASVDHALWVCHGIGMTRQNPRPSSGSSPFEQVRHQVAEAAAFVIGTCLESLHQEPGQGRRNTLRTSLRNFQGQGS